MITLAHLSDPHLGPMPAASFAELASKRALGYLNWHRRRKSFHLREIADLMAQDLRTVAPDHIAVTGDLVNISLRPEFGLALGWLEALGGGETVSVVPGNHDAYVKLPWDRTLGQWEPYMRSNEEGRTHVATDAIFPYVRIIGHVAVIGVSTAIPTPPFCAFGTLGRAQLDRLDAILKSLDDAPLCRVLLIHHPPLIHQTSRRKGITDTRALASLLERRHVDLVLHGHNHRDMYEAFETSRGLMHIFGVPSASGAHFDHRPAAQYNLYEIERRNGSFACRIAIRGVSTDLKAFDEIKQLEISP